MTTRFLLAFIAGALISSQPAMAKSGGPSVAWQTSWKAAQDVSRKTGKPIFVYFHAAWCGPCRALDKTVWSNARVIRASRAWVPFKADLDTQTDLATRFNVKTPPIVVFLDSKTRKISSLLGYNDAKAMSAAMQNAAHPTKK